MNNFLILIREDGARYEEMSEEVMQAEIQAYTEWAEELGASGNYLSGDPLDAEGRYMRADSVESNGPFLEAKEAITGYFLLQAKDLDEAEALARTCPVFKYGGVLELRPIMKF